MSTRTQNTHDDGRLFGYDPTTGTTWTELTLDQAAAPAPTFTKTEALRRLRILGKMARQYDGDIPGNARTEVGSRTTTVVTEHRPNVRDAFAPDDDLYDFHTLAAAAARPDITGPGTVVHLYFSEPLTRWGGGDLVNTITAWMGTATEPPALIDVPGARLPDEEAVR